MYTENRDFEKEDKNKKSNKLDMLHNEYTYKPDIEEDDYYENNKKEDFGKFTLFSFLMIVITMVYNGIIFSLIMRNIYNIKGIELYSYNGKVHTNISIILYVIFFIFLMLFAESKNGRVIIKVNRQIEKAIKTVMIIVFIILCIVDVSFSKNLSTMNYLDGNTVSMLINGKVQNVKIQDIKDIRVYNEIYRTGGKHSYNYLGVDASFYYNNKVYTLIDCGSVERLNTLKYILNEFNKTNPEVKEIYLPNKYVNTGKIPSFSSLPNKFIIYVEPESQLLTRAEKKDMTSVAYDFVNKNHNFVFDENFLTNLYKPTTQQTQKDTPKEETKTNTNTNTTSKNNIDLNKTETVTYTDIQDNGKHELVPVKTSNPNEKMFQYGDKVIYVVKTQSDKVIYILYNNESFSPIDYNSDTKKYTFISGGKRIYLDKNIYDTCVNSL